jgi:hypothetical protein
MLWSEGVSLFIVVGVGPWIQMLSISSLISNLFKWRVVIHQTCVSASVFKISTSVNQPMMIGSSRTTCQPPKVKKTPASKNPLCSSVLLVGGGEDPRPHLAPTETRQVLLGPSPVATSWVACGARVWHTNSLLILCCCSFTTGGAHTTVLGEGDSSDVFMMDQCEGGGSPVTTSAAASSRVVG